MVGQLPTAAAAVVGDDRPLDDAGISGAARAAISAGGGIERRDELGGRRPARPRVVVGFDPGLQIPGGLGDGRGVVGAGLPGMDRRHQRRLQEQVGGVVGGHPMYNIYIYNCISFSVWPVGVLLLRSIFASCDCSMQYFFGASRRRQLVGLVGGRRQISDFGAYVLWPF